MEQLSREERFKRAKEAREKALKESENGGFEKVEVPEMECVALRPNKSQIVRFIGESLELSNSDTDPVVVERSLTKDDDGNWFSIIWSNDPDHPMNKLKKTILGKYEWNNELKTKIYENKDLEVFKRFTDNGTGSPYDKGMLPQSYIMMNCITRGEGDTWCKDNKHTKLLCWDVNEEEKDGKKVCYYTHGIKKSLYNEVWDKQCTIRNRHFEDFDILVRRLDKKTKIGDNGYLVVNIAEEKSAIMNWENKDGCKYLQYMNDEPLSDEERNYERYVTKNIPFISKPTPCGVLLKKLSKLIKQTDAQFGTHHYEEFVEWKSKEIEDSKKNVEETKSSNEEVEENKSFENMDSVNTDTSSIDNDLPSDVEEPIAPPQKKVMKSIKTVSFDPLSLKDIFPHIVEMKESDRNMIIGVNEDSGELIYNTDDIATCPVCNMDIPDPWTSCVCGTKFE